MKHRVERIVIDTDADPAIFYYLPVIVRVFRDDKTEREYPDPQGSTFITLSSLRRCQRAQLLLLGQDVAIERLSNE